MKNDNTEICENDRFEKFNTIKVGGIKINRLLYSGGAEYNHFVYALKVRSSNEVREIDIMINNNEPIIKFHPEVYYGIDFLNDLVKVAKEISKEVEVYENNNNNINKNN